MQLTRPQFIERLRRETAHLPDQDVAALTDIIERLVAVYEPDRIYLFGSKARGDWKPHSDFDLMVIVPDDAQWERLDSNLARQALRGVGRPADLLVFTVTDFASRAHLRASLPGIALREGKLLYMVPDPILIAETRSWFTRAYEDLEAAAYLLGAPRPLLASVVYHCQQSAEKALKGFLTWHNEPVQKTHILEDVGNQCLILDASLQPLVTRAAKLTDYAWKFRYPNPKGPDNPSETETREALVIAREVYEEVLSRLPPEIWP